MKARIDLPGRHRPLIRGLALSLVLVAAACQTPAPPPVPAAEERPSPPPGPTPRVTEQITLLPSADGKASGAVLVTVDGKELLLDQPYATADLTRGGAMGVRTASAEEVRRVAGEALRALPPKPASFTLLFDLDSSEPRPGQEAIIDAIAAEIDRRQVPDVSIIGHADRSGASDYNLTLSIRRATVVHKLISARGTKGQIEVVGKGDSENVVPQLKRSAELRNRRVEVYVR